MTTPAPSLLGGTNYAWGSAETGSGLSAFGVPNVGLQVDQFLADRGGFGGDELRSGTLFRHFEPEPGS